MPPAMVRVGCWKRSATWEDAEGPQGRRWGPAAPAGPILAAEIRVVVLVTSWRRAMTSPEGDSPLSELLVQRAVVRTLKSVSVLWKGMPLSLGAFCRDATVQSEMFGVV